LQEDEEEEEEEEAEKEPMMELIVSIQLFSLRGS
jgi:hypothetical protein